MLKFIIGILGLALGVWCVLDILKKDLDFVKKALLIALVIIASWIGVAIYYFIIRKRI